MEIGISDSEQGTTEHTAAGQMLPEKVNREFSVVSGNITAGRRPFHGFEPAEIELLIKLLEEKRRSLSGNAVMAPTMHLWTSADHIQKGLMEDHRGAVVYAAREERLRAGPLRFIGFESDDGFRIFKFARLPAVSGQGVFRVGVRLDYFSRGALSLQDGPALCAAIIANQPEPAHHEATEEEIAAFLASRPATARPKGPRKQAG